MAMQQQIYQTGTPYQLSTSGGISYLDTETLLKLDKIYTKRVLRVARKLNGGTVINENGLYLHVYNPRR